MEPLARVKLGSDAPAEIIRLLPLVGLEPVLHRSTALPSARADAPPTAAPIAVRVNFSVHSPDAIAATNTISAPAPFSIAFNAVPLAQDRTADLITDSAIATACFILSHALGLAVPFLTADANLFDVIRAATAVARGPARILVEGELGVGKKSLIKLIHAASRDSAELVHAECAGLAADAVDAEFAPLLARAANSASTHTGGGAIFFNRIGELSPLAQRKLLDLLRAFAPAPPSRREAPGPHDARDRRDAIAASVRILAASNRPLAAMVTGGELLPELHDLFDATLTISPLRTRRGDLPLLVRHYLRELNPALTLSADALRALSVYPFPGNTLEFSNFVTRVAIVPPRAGARRAATGFGKIGVVGRAEVVSQLDHGSLNTVWRSRVRREPRVGRSREIAAPTDIPGDDEAAPALLSLTIPALASPAALRLTAGVVPRLRKPRGGHHRPRPQSE